MAYTLYADGSIEAKLPHGTVRFGSSAELRAHIERTRSPRSHGGARRRTSAQQTCLCLRQGFSPPSSDDGAFQHGRMSSRGNGRWPCRILPNERGPSLRQRPQNWCRAENIGSVGLRYNDKIYSCLRRERCVQLRRFTSSVRGDAPISNGFEVCCAGRRIGCQSSARQPKKL
jgi:hypothetical protein